MTGAGDDATREDANVAVEQPENDVEITGLESAIAEYDQLYADAPLCPLCEERVKPWHETVGDQGDTHLACWQTVLAVSGVDGA